MTDEWIRVPFRQAEARLTSVFAGAGLTATDAGALATILATSSLEGVPSHGIRFFGPILDGIRSGGISPTAAPTRSGSFGAWERWDGNRGPGPLNAMRMTARAMQLAEDHGVGAVALRNTHHWTRAGHYGRQAARSGFGLICWANTPAVMPPWGGTRPRLGNNPIVFALPDGDPPLVVDLALSQFSIGRLETARSKAERLPVDGGYDGDGCLTRDPAAILASGRALPIGYWKGSGLAVLLDLFAALLAGGPTTLDATAGPEAGASQVFVAFDLARRVDRDGLRATIARVVDDLRASSSAVRLPGERAAASRAENLAAGVPVEAAVWRRVCGEAGVRA